MSYRIDQADVLDWHNEGLYHAMLCDPPYELGFMGKSWDDTGVAFQPETWAHLSQFLHPGAFIMAFGGSRTHHRLACAIEDAGFIVHPSIVWVTGSGFPKATRIDTQIDKFGGLPIPRQEIAAAIKMAREKRGLTIGECDDRFCGGTTNWSWYEGRPNGINIPDGNTFITIAKEWPELQKYADAVGAWEREVVGKSDSGLHRGSGTTVAFGEGNDRTMPNLTAPATPLAQAWEGHRYGLQALKPAAEMVVVAQKPYAGKPVDCITGTGAGALNVDGGRVGTSGGGTHCNNRDAEGRCLGHDNAGRSTSGETIHGPETSSGRWPANFILGHSPECIRTGTRRVRGSRERIETTGDSTISKTGGLGIEGGRPVGFATPGYADPDGLETIDAWDCAPDCFVRRLGDEARFFFQSDWNLEQADPFKYEGKASRGEREAGLIHVLPCVTCGELHSTHHIVTDKDGKEREVKCIRNPHPTQKPISLTQYLATLLLPPAEYAPRRILVPFAGVAGEMIGSHLAGWDEVVGIEKEPEYVKIAEARLAHWTMQPTLV